MTMFRTILKAATAASALAFSVGGASAATLIELVSVSTQINPGAGISEFVYTVTNNTRFADIVQFEIPEFRLGDLFEAVPTLGSRSASLTGGWLLSESTTSVLFPSGEGFYKGKPGGYILISGGAIEAGQSQSFSFFTHRVGSTNAQIIFDLPGAEQTFVVDPPIPGTAGVPEPTEWALMLTGFGLAGAALRSANGRRRKQAIVSYV
jgi:hypothetical protein